MHCIPPPAGGRYESISPLQEGKAGARGECASSFVVRLSHGVAVGSRLDGPTDATRTFGESVVPPPRSGHALHEPAAKPGRGLLRRGSCGSRCRGQGRRGWPEQAAMRADAGRRAARAVWATAAGREEDRLARRVPQRRSDGLPARDCWCGSAPRRAGARCESPPRPEPVPSPRRGGSLPPRPQPPVRHGRPGGGAGRPCRAAG